jgi:hypothetical protein
MTARCSTGGNQQACCYLFSQEDPPQLRSFLSLSHIYLILIFLQHYPIYLFLGSIFEIHLSMAQHITYKMLDFLFHHYSPSLSFCDLLLLVINYPSLNFIQQALMVMVHSYSHLPHKEKSHRQHIMPSLLFVLWWSNPLAM